MKQIIRQHVTDPAITMTANQEIKGVEFRQTGTTYGRFIFDRSPCIEIPTGAENCRIVNCDFWGESYTNSAGQ